MRNDNLKEKKKRTSNVRSRTVKILSSEYATFRPEIQEYFKKHVLKEPSIMLDPMAGTAPLIPFIETHGHKAYFNDILPIHSFVNRAKTYGIFKCYQKNGYEWFFQQLLHCMAPLQDKRLCISDKWIDDSVLDGLIQAWHTAEAYANDVATFFKAAILLCVRPFSSFTRTANPTWFKYGGMSSGKDLREIVGESLTTFDKYYRHSYNSSPITKKGQCIFTTQDAAGFHPEEKVNLILTSPPYCNRLDGIVQYGPENYFLSEVGCSIPEKAMIGTTKARDYETFAEDFEYLTNNSKYASVLLNPIKKSPNRDDRTYYLKYYTRYLAMVSRTIDKVLDNLSPTGEMYIVTQDNNHRGQLIEIDKVLRELLKANGWRSKEVKKWERHHLGLRNISWDHAFVKPKQFEKLVLIWR